MWRYLACIALGACGVLLAGLVLHPGPSASDRAIEAQRANAARIQSEYLVTVEQSNGRLSSAVDVEGETNRQLRNQLSEAGWEKSRKDHEATLNELSLFKADFENYVKSSADRAKVDNDAVTTLTRERDDARGHEVLVGAGGVLFGLGLWELAHLVGWIP